MFSFKYRLFTALMLFGVYGVFAQYQIPEKPEFQTSVYDYVGLLNDGQKAGLENKLIKYSDTTTTQIVVVIIASTNGEDINYLGANWGEKWGIGQAKQDNGILILLAKDDRKIAIQTGKGVEHLLTDAMSKRIIENDILPQFRTGDYYSGLDQAADAIFYVMRGEYEGTRPQDETSPSPKSFLPILFIIIIIIFIFSRNRRNKGPRSAAGTIMDAIILSSLGRGGFGGGSSGGGFGGGGGGFGGGFGGGSFGGGGASGSW